MQSRCGKFSNAEHGLRCKTAVRVCRICVTQALFMGISTARVSFAHHLIPIALPLFWRHILVSTNPNYFAVRVVIAEFGYNLCDSEWKELESPRISAQESHRAPELRSSAWPGPATDVFVWVSTCVGLIFCRPLHRSVSLTARMGALH